MAEIKREAVMQECPVYVKCCDDWDIPDYQVCVREMRGTVDECPLILSGKYQEATCESDDSQAD